MLQMLEAENSPDFQDDLNYVVTAQEAASWYGMTYPEVKHDLESGALAGRLSCSVWLVSVDSVYELYGPPVVALGRRGAAFKSDVKRAVNAPEPRSGARSAGLDSE
jgi:hypothetical protein